jgi:hypothetical protein
MIDKTMLQIGSDQELLWVVIEPIHKIKLRILIVAKQLRSLVEIYGKQIVYSDAGTWHPEAHILLGLVVFTT